MNEPVTNDQCLLFGDVIGTGLYGNGNVGHIRLWRHYPQTVFEQWARVRGEVSMAMLTPKGNPMSHRGGGYNFKLYDVL